MRSTVLAARDLAAPILWPANIAGSLSVVIRHGSLTVL